MLLIYKFCQNYVSNLCRSHHSCRVSSDSITALLTHRLVSLLWTGRHDLIRRLWGWLKTIAFCFSLNYLLNVAFLLFKAIFIYYTGTTPAVTSTKHAFPRISFSYVHTHTHTHIQAETDANILIAPHTHTTNTAGNTNTCTASSSQTKTRGVGWISMLIGLKLYNYNKWMSEFWGWMVF